MKKYLLASFIVFVVVSCNNADIKKTEPSVNHNKEIIETDKAFSEMSKKEGMRAAFLEYIDSNGVLLRPGTLPLIGGQAINYISQENDTTYTMVWEPQGAFVSKSGDLGYTYGLYALTMKTTNEVKYGTYVSIWKKQNDGSWKFALDSGNDGIGD